MKKDKPQNKTATLIKKPSQAFGQTELLQVESILSTLFFRHFLGF
jgi:hypothetical protein